MLQLLEETLVKLLAYAISALVALLMTIHVLGSVDWLTILPDWDLGGVFSGTGMPDEEGCITMPDGLIVCDPKGIQLQGDQP